MSRALSRREFVARSALAGGAAWLSLSLPRPKAVRAAAESADPVTFDASQWKLVDAITARILPTDEDPGAREAGCVNFIDKALAHEDAASKPDYEAGLRGVEAVSTKRHGKPFTDLSASWQDALLEALQDGKADGWPEGSLTSPAFFETIRVHTIVGFLADPKYGGNRDYAGWRLVGYPGPRHHLGGYTREEMSGEKKIRTVWGEEV